MVAVLVQQAHIHREMLIDRVLDRLPDDPRIVIVGSSHSARGIDGEALQAALHVPVAQLTYPGVFAFEQDEALERYLARARPKLVLIELISEFYVQQEREPYASRNIQFADIARTWWAVRIVMSRPDKFLAETLEAVRDRIGDMLAHLTNAGIILHAKHDRTWTLKGYVPSDERAVGVTDEEIARALKSDDETGIDLAAATAFRLWQRDRVLAAGVPDVRFYVPPIADPMRRGWADALCASLGSRCLPMDIGFLRSLSPRMWADTAHLKSGGAQLYTRWFAERLSALQ